MPEHWLAVLPIAATGLAACLVFVLSAFWKNPRGLGIFTLLLTLGASGGSVIYLWQRGGMAVPSSDTNPIGLVTSDLLALFFDGLFVIVAALVILFAIDYFERKGFHRGEFYGMLLLSLTGMMVLASATNLITFYLGLETMSIGFYVLAGFLRNLENSVEASLKYFLLGAFSSAFLLFGMALLYGSTGSLDYIDIASASSGMGLFTFGAPLALMGFFLLLVGIFFKLSLIPFHFWAPDVYQGAPTPVTAFMAVGGKAAATAAAIRLFLTAFSRSDMFAEKWFTAFVGVGLITIFVGGMIALTQRHMKRLLAYSSIVHAGFIALGLAGLAALPKDQVPVMLEAILFYLTAYMFMNIGAFTIASLMEAPDRTDEGLRGFAGLGTSAPKVAALLSLLMFSLLGMPLTVGFLGKFYIFHPGADGKFYWIAAMGLIGAVIATYYYLKVVVTLYFPPAGEEIAEAPKVSPLAWSVLVLTCVPVLAFGVFPHLINRIISGVGIG